MTLFGRPSMRLGDYRLNVSDADRRNDIDFPILGWSAFNRLYNLADPPRSIPRGALRSASLFSLAPTTTFDREEHKDILPVALEAAGATKVDPSAWWMMRVGGSPVGYQLKTRPIENATTCGSRLRGLPIENA